MPLNAPALSELALEKTFLALFEEWLRGFFDGGAHAVGDNAPVSFPQAELRFQQSALTQPLNGLGLSLVWDGRSDVTLYWDTVSGGRQQMARAKTSFLFWVRCAMQPAASANAATQATLGGDRLFAVLQNSSAARPLAQKGIHRLRPGPPRVVADTNFQLRLIVCEAELRYPVLSQTTP